MDRREFAAEFGGILSLLRDHGFLAYTPSGRREYEQKLEACSGLFAHLVFRMTSVPVTILPGIPPIAEAREPSFAAAKALVARAARRARAAERKAAGADRERYAACADLWERAAAKLAKPEA